MNDSAEIDDEMALKMLKGIMAAHDSEYELWDRESVEFSRKQYQKHWGKIPNVGTVSEMVGIARAERMIPEIIAAREFDHALKGKGSPCHLCGGSKNLNHTQFGLMRVESSKRSWGATAATIAVSAVTLPLLGGGSVRLPGNSHSGALLRLNLIVCEACVTNNKNIFGVLFVKERHAMHHPLWKPLHEAGFEKYIAPDELEKDHLGYMKL